MLQLKDDEGSLGSPTFSPNGKKIAAARGSYQLTIWDSITGKILQQIDSGKSKEDGSLQSLTWSPDSRYLAGVFVEQGQPGAIGNLFVWDSASGHQLQIANRAGTGSSFADKQGKIPILDAHWNPKSSAILLLEADSQARLVDFPSATTRWLIPLKMFDNGNIDDSAFDPFYCFQTLCRLVWNPTGTEFVSRNGVGQIFNANTGRPVLSLAEPRYGDSRAEWTSDGKYIFDVPISDGGNGPVYVWDTTTGLLIDIPLKTIDGISFDLNPDNARIAYTLTGEHKIIAVANWHTGEVLANIPIPGSGLLPGLSWSPDGRRLAVSTEHLILVFSEESLVF